MDLRFPRPLRPGDRIGVTAPSAGVQPSMRARLDAAVAALGGRGLEVVLGECLGTTGVTAAPKEQRAAELTAMLCDPTIAAVVPPWGGELGIDVLDQLDWAALEQAEPTWLVGFSDTSLLLVALTTRLGWGTLHGSNLMDSPYDPPAGLLHWVDVASATGPVTQRSPGRYRTSGWDDYENDPGVSTMTLDGAGGWSVLGGGGADVTGRLIGGCVEIMGPIAGTPYGDVRAFGERHADEGLLVYLEACEDNAYTIARTLHGLRLAGWFDHANAVLVGRTAAPDAPDLSQREAVADALGGLDVPVVLDVECGHVQPFLPLVNGASARVVVDDRRHELVQEW
ncbi:LD-carboxypeptidase [Nocardioides sp. zg-579]|uniref:LD-carboxypeptidase n=1 Tax=Nocardioides marmotae TaxID=2663857 RepID=A0A6I3JFV1_9ACTN|nr:S66 peptidase family protein [Nocardioides marmotae]MCR6033486.1 LD-carboxypeptidase [Gordonia jinghuaiqii]MTB97144.1 LD-carboxypeptidase [Nocardioides marmotae]QKE00795.1 LD-carboxypeptidase [Nocardioides marmotae]